MALLSKARGLEVAVTAVQRILSGLASSNLVSECGARVMRELQAYEQDMVGDVLRALGFSEDEVRHMVLQPLPKEGV